MDLPIVSSPTASQIQTFELEIAALTSVFQVVHLRTGYKLLPWLTLSDWTVFKQ
jgi:hypothetical protein